MVRKTLFLAFLGVMIEAYTSFAAIDMSRTDPDGIHVILSSMLHDTFRDDTDKSSATEINGDCRIGQGGFTEWEFSYKPSPDGKPSVNGVARCLVTIDLTVNGSYDLTIDGARVKSSQTGENLTFEYSTDCGIPVAYDSETGEYTVKPGISVPNADNFTNNYVIVNNISVMITVVSSSVVNTLPVRNEMSLEKTAAGYDAGGSFLKLAEKNVTLAIPQDLPWLTGSSHYINWTSTGVTFVNLEYSSDGGLTWRRIIYGIVASATRYPWIVPDEASRFYRIRISDATDSAVENVMAVTVVSSDFTEKIFNFNDTYTTYFFGGNNQDAYKGMNAGIGQSYFFEYDSHIHSVTFTFRSFFDYMQNPTNHGNSVTLVLQIRNESGAILSTVEKLIPADFKGDMIVFDTDCHVDAQHSYIFTCYMKNGDTVQLSNKVWGSSVDKMYNGTGYSAEVIPGGNIDDWANWHEVYYDYALKLSYSINPIKIISPTTSVSWLSGTTQCIMWLSTGLNTVKLEYSTDNGVTWSLITSSTSATQGNFSWTVPVLENANTCILRITDTENELYRDVLNGVITVIQSSTLAESDWPMRAQNSQHTGRAEATRETAGIPKWFYPTGDIMYSSPVIDTDGTIYFGTVYDYSLVALSPEGMLKWKFATGNTIISTPAIDSDGTIIVGSYDSYLYAIKKDGTLKWKYKTNNVIRSSPVIGKNGVIYIGSDDGYLHCVYPNGTMKWKYQANAPITSSPALDADGNVYFGTMAPYSGLTYYYLYAVTPDGTLKWRFQTEKAIQSSPAIDSDGTVYIGSDDTLLYAVSSNGVLKWKYKTDNAITASPAIDSDGTVYIGSTDKSLYALTSAGALKWKYTSNGPIQSSPVINAQHTVFFGSNDGYVYAIKPDGTLKWKFRTNADICSSPALNTDGTLYIGSCDQYFYVFPPETPGISLIAPNGGDFFLPGSTFPISWYATVIAYVKVEFSVDNGSTWTIIGNNIPAAESYLWTVPPSVSSACLIKVSDALYPTITDTSDASFSIIDLGLWGDVNNDGLISMLDALIVARYSLYVDLSENELPVVLAPYYQFIRLRGDVSAGADTVTNSDALMIARYINNPGNTNLPSRIGKKQGTVSKISTDTYTAAPLHIDTDVRIDRFDTESFQINISLNAQFTTDNIGAGTIEVRWDPDSYQYAGYDNNGENIIIADDWVREGKLRLTKIDTDGENPFAFPALRLTRQGHDVSDQITVSVLSGVTTESYSELPAPVTNSYLMGNTGEVPHTFSLYQNSPNPFNPNTVIRYSMSRPSHVTLTVFNVSGQKVKTLVDTYMTDGAHSITWDATDENGVRMASGVYIYRLATQGTVEQKQMLLLR